MLSHLSKGKVLLHAFIGTVRQWLPVWSGICPYIHVDCGNGAVFLSTHLDRHPHRMAGGVCNELFLTGIAVVDWFSGYPSGISHQILNQNILLAAIPTTNTLLDDSNLVLWNLTDPREQFFLHGREPGWRH